MTEATLTAQAPYALGHSQDELNRLTSQARFNGDLAEQVLRLAGLTPGMEVLDIGCGAGDISFLAASLVGPQGRVTGVDKAPEAIARASERAAAARLSNVHFVTADLADYRPQHPFDALIGSRILMYFTDPAVVLRRLAEFVRPGGVIAFHEYDLEGWKAEPPNSFFELAMERVIQTLARGGGDVRAGLKLGQIFEDAGLPTPQMIQGARVERGANAEAYNQIEQVSRSLLPLMERTGVATARDVDIDTLAMRLRASALANGTTIVAPPLIGAWTRNRAA
jgi:ubiquinone/menaquinone biosynthesis C-methylase UbiE